MALNLSFNELMLWREVFQEEYYELHPEKRPVDENQIQANIEMFKQFVSSKNNKVIVKNG